MVSTFLAITIHFEFSKNESFLYWIQHEEKMSFRERKEQTDVINLTQSFYLTNLPLWYSYAAEFVIQSS